MCPNHWHRPDDENVGNLLSQAVFTKSSNQAITTGTGTDLTWETQTSYGNVSSDFEIDSVDDTLINIKRTGTYLLELTVKWGFGATGARSVYLRQAGTNRKQFHMLAHAGIVERLMVVSVYLVEQTPMPWQARVYHTQGANLNAESNETEYKITRIGEV